ncbi:MAG: zinc ribbon domain-containing protein [Acidobacteriota bacterium]|nr:zinc ribbon domain-containing protein [Acidobacteriota bacterium]
MYCPNCGKENSNEQRFCRSCGLSLQMISQMLVNELSATESDDSSIEIIKREERRWQNPLMYGFLMLTLGIIIVIFGKTILGEQLIADIGTVMAFLGIGLLGFKGVSLMLSQSSSSPQSKALSEGEPMTRLPPASRTGELPSITEHTTHHLEPIYSKRKAE